MGGWGDPRYIVNLTWEPVVSHDWLNWWSSIQFQSILPTPLDILFPQWRTSLHNQSTWLASQDNDWWHYKMTTSNWPDQTAILQCSPPLFFKVITILLLIIECNNNQQWFKQIDESMLSLLELPTVSIGKDSLSLYLFVSLSLIMFPPPHFYSLFTLFGLSTLVVLLCSYIKPCSVYRQTPSGEFGQAP